MARTLTIDIKVTDNASGSIDAVVQGLQKFADLQAKTVASAVEAQRKATSQIVQTVANGERTKAAEIIAGGRMAAVAELNASRERVSAARTASNELIATNRVASQTFVAESRAASARYVADKRAASNEAVATIRVQGSQEVAVTQAASREKVATIQAASREAVAVTNRTARENTATITSNARIQTTEITTQARVQTAEITTQGRIQVAEINANQRSQTAAARLAYQQQKDAAREAAKAQKAAAAEAAAAAKAAAKDFVSLQEAMDVNRRQAYALTIAGFQLKGMADALKQSISGLIDGFTGYDFALRRAAGALSVAASNTTQFDRLSKSVRDIAVATKMFSPEQVAKGYYFWGSTTGMVADSQEKLLEIEKQLIPVMKLAAMTETDLEQSIKGVIGIAQQFTRPMSDVKTITEELFSAAQKTALEFPNLIESFKMVGPIAAGFGVSLEDVIKTLGALGTVGLRGSQAGRGLAMMFSHIAEQTPKATKLLDEAAKKANLLAEGQDFRSLIFPDGVFIGMQGYIDLLSKMTMNMDMAEKQTLIAGITSQNEWRMLQPLVDANTAALIKNAEAGKEATGGIISQSQVLEGAAETFKNSWDQIGKSAKAAFGEMSNRWAQFSLLLGKALVEALIPILDTIGKIGDALGQWAEQNPELMKLIAQIALLGAGFLSVSASALLGISAFKLMGGTVIPELIASFFRLDTEVVSMSNYLGKAGDVAKANFNKIGTGILDFFGGLATKVPALISTALANPMALFSSFAAAVEGALAPIIATFSQIAIFVGVVAIAAGAVFKIVTDNIDKFGPLFEAVGGTIERVFGFVLNLVGGLFKLGEAIGGVLSPAVGVLLDLLTVMFKSLNQFLDWLSSTLGSIDTSGLTKLAETIGRLVEVLSSSAMTVASGALTIIEGAAKAAGEWVKFLVDQLKWLLNASDVKPQNYINRGGKVLFADKQLTTGGGSNLSPLHTKELNSQTYALQAQTKAVQDLLDAYVPVPYQLQSIADKTAAVQAAVTAQSQGLALNGQAWTDYVSKMAGSLGAFDQVGSKIKDLLNQMGDPDKTVARKAYDVVRTYAAGMIEAAGTEIDPAIKAMFTAASDAVKSNTPAGRIAGKQVMAIIAQGMATGHKEQIMPRIALMLQGALDQMSSSNPKFQKEGLDKVRAIAAGLAKSNLVDEKTKNLINQALTMMGSSNKNFQSTGANWIISIVNGVSGALPMLANALEKVAAATSIVLGKNSFTSGLMAAVKGMRSASLIDITDVGLGNGDKGSGGGGGGGSEKTPLEKALEVAKNAADLAEALNKIKGQNLKKLVQEAMGPVAEAMVLAEKITAKAAKGFSKAQLEKVAEFSDAMSKIASFINGAFDALSKAKDFKKVSSKVFDDLFSGVRYAVKKMEDVAKLFTGTKGRNTLLAQAVSFSEASTSIVSAIGDAFEAFDNVPEDFVAPSQALMDKVADAIRSAVNSMERVVKPDEETLLTLAKDFASAGGEVVKTISDALDAFSRPFNFTAPTDAQLEAIVESIRQAIDKLVRKMQKFNEDFGIVGGKESESYKIIQDFASSVSAVMSAIKSAFDISQSTETRDPAKFSGPSPMSQYMQLIDDMVKVVTYMNTTLGSLNLDWEHIQEVAQTAGAVVQAIQAFFSLAGESMKSGTDNQSMLDMITVNLDTISNVVANFIGEFTAYGADLIKNFASGMNSQITFLQSVIAQIQSIVNSSFQGKATITVAWNAAGYTAQGNPAGSGSGTNTTTAGGAPASGAGASSAPASGAGASTVQSAAATTQNVNVTVTSPDGSVNGSNASAIGSAIGQALIGNIRHSASVT